MKLKRHQVGDDKYEKRVDRDIRDVLCAIWTFLSLKKYTLIFILYMGVLPDFIGGHFHKLFGTNSYEQLTKAILSAICCQLATWDFYEKYSYYEN